MEEKVGRMKQTKLSAFIDFKSEVIGINKYNLKYIEHKDGKYDLITRTAIDLTKNTLMQENVKQRLELQREIRNITHFVNGKSMSQLYLDKRKKGRFLAILKIST